MKKAIRILLLALAIVGTLSMASCRKADDNAPVSIENVKTSVFKSQFPEMVELGKNQLSNYYTYEEIWFKEFSVYIADTESLCDEVAIFRLSDGEYLKSVVAAIEQRVNSQFSITNAQNSAETMKLSNRILLQKDDIVVMVISEHVKEIADRLKQEYGFLPLQI